MLVFNTYFKLVKRYRGNIILYFVIFFAVAIGMTMLLSSPGEDVFTQEQLTVSIIDRDGKTMGDNIKEYFAEGVEFVEVEDDKRAIENELYWRAVDYVLIIPKGFEESLKDEKTLELQCMKVPGNFESTYFESEFSLYSSKLMSLLKSGYSLEETNEMLTKSQDKKAEVKIASFANAKQNDAATNFFGYAPYLFITVGVIAVGIILLCFNKEEVKNRTECGALPMRQRMTGLVAGSFVLGFILYAAVLLGGIVISKGSILTDIRFPFFMLNILAMLIFGLSLGFFAGMVSKTSESVNGMVNVLSLGLCFGGGVFVPLEFFGDNVEKVCRFLPTYWYTVSNQNIGAMKEVTDVFLKDTFIQIGLVLCFALVVFAVTLVIVSSKRKQTA